jgi:RNA polymerase sigma-70 factor (ECF subfamily)
MDLAYRLLGKDDEVEDVIQEACFNALNSLHRLRDPEAFGPWLAGIVVRMVRRVHRRRGLLRRFGLYSSAPADPDLALSPSTPPDVASELRLIYRVLDTLSTEARLVLLLRRVEGYSLPEIAELLKCSLSTIKRRWSEAERALRNYTSEGL